MVNLEVDRRDRRRRRAQKFARIVTHAASAAFVASQIPGIAHASPVRQPENPSAPPAGQVSQEQKAERTKRFHGGKKISSPIVVGSHLAVPAEKSHTQQRQQKAPIRDGNHHLYSSTARKNTHSSPAYSGPSGRGVNAKEHGFITGKPFTGQENRKKEEKETEGIYQLLGVLSKVSPGEAQFLRSTLDGVVNGSLPSVSISSIEQQATEAFNNSLVKIILKASPSDLENLASLEFDKISNHKISELVNQANITQDQISVSQLFAEEVSQIFDRHQGKFDQSTQHEIENTISSFKIDFHDNGSFFIGGAVLALLFGTVATAACNKNTKIKLLNLFLGITILLTACEPNVSGTITPVPTGTSIPATIEADPTATVIIPENSEPIIRSPYLNLGIGDFGGGQIYGTIPGSEIAENNQGFFLPDSQVASRHNVYYRYDATDISRGIGLDQQYLDDVFNAGGKGSGMLPDGTPVNLVGGFWVIEKDGQKLYFNPIVANLVTNPGGVFGYPILVQNESGQLFFGVTNEHGALLDDLRLVSAFQSAEDLARNLGYTGDISLIDSFSYDLYGNIILKDDSGNVLSILPFLNPSEVTENPYVNVDLMNVSTIPNTEYFQTGVWPTADTQIAQAPYFDAANSKFLIEHGVSETEVSKMTEYERFLQSAIIANENNIIPPISLDLVYRMLQDTPQLGAVSQNGLGISAGTKWNPERALFGENYTLKTFNRDLLVTHVPFGSIAAEGAVVVKYADNISGFIAYYHTDDGQLRFVPLRMIDRQITVNQLIQQEQSSIPNEKGTQGYFYVANIPFVIFEDGLAYDGQELEFANQQRLAGKSFAIEADHSGIDPQTGLEILKRIYGQLNPPSP